MTDGTTANTPKCKDHGNSRFPSGMTTRKAMTNKRGDDNKKGDDNRKGNDQKGE
jgi:hypothetical protein